MYKSYISFNHGSKIKKRGSWMNYTVSILQEKGICDGWGKI